MKSLVSFEVKEARRKKECIIFKMGKYEKGNSRYDIFEDVASFLERIWNIGSFDAFYRLRDILEEVIRREVELKSIEKTIDDSWVISSEEKERLKKRKEEILKELEQIFSKEPAKD